MREFSCSGPGVVVFADNHLARMTHGPLDRDRSSQHAFDTARKHIAASAVRQRCRCTAARLTTPARLLCFLCKH